MRENNGTNIVTRSKSRDLAPRRSSRLSSTVCNMYRATYATGVWDDERKANFFYHQLRKCLKSKRNFRYGPDYVISSGTSWIAVRDAKRTCVVVSINTHPEPGLEDVRSLLDHRIKIPMPANITVQKRLCEIGDMSHHLRKRIGQSSETGPFAIVSVAPGTIGDHLESDKVSNAIDFPKAKLKNRLSLDLSEAEQLVCADCSMCAIYHLLGPKFDSSKMKAIGYRYGRGGIGISSSDVDKYLATINKTTNGDRMDFLTETSTGCCDEQDGISGCTSAARDI